MKPIGLALIIFYLAQSNCVAQEVELWIDIVNRLVEERKAIQNGEVTLTASFEGDDSKTSYSWNLCFDEDRQRADYNGDSGNLWRVNCVGCEWDGLLHYLSGPEESALSIYAPSELKKPLHLTPDAALFGFSSFSTLDSALHSPAELLGEVNAFKVAMLPYEGKEDEAAVLEWQISDALIRRLTVQRLPFPAILEVETRLVRGKKIIADKSTYSVDLTETGIAYPTKWEHQNVVNGDVVQRETGLVENAVFNEADLNKLTLSGLPMLKPGTKIYWSNDSPRPCAPTSSIEWDGEQVVCIDPEPIKVVDTDRGGDIRLWILLCNVGVLLIGVGFYMAKKRKR